MLLNVDVFNSDDISSQYNILYNDLIGFYTVYWFGGCKQSEKNPKMYHGIKI